MASHNLLGEGAALQAGEQLISPDGKTRFVMQPDGNAVVYQKPPSGGTGERVLFATHNGDTLGVDGVATKFIVTRTHDLVSVDDTGKIIWSSKTEGKGEGRVTLALGDNGILALVDEADHAIWHTGPTGIKALIANLKAGATFLGERATYYASEAYKKAREIGEKALEGGKHAAADASARARELGEAAHTKAAEVGAKAKEVGDAAAAKAGELGAKAKEVGGAAVTKAKEVGDAAAAKAGEFGAKAGDFAHNVQETASHVAHDVADKAKAGAQAVQAEFAHK